MLVLGQLVVFLAALDSVSLLHVQRNEYRFLDTLDGLWTFVMEPPNSVGIGFINHWASANLATFYNYTVMPVPTAFNDLAASHSIRDHLGWVWYQYRYLSPLLLSSDKQIVLHLESVNYACFVFVNGELLMQHIGGHLPFQTEIPSRITSQHNKSLLITIAINNTLSHETIPPAEFNVETLPSGRKLIKQTLGFDFFNYAGILRPIHVAYLPQAHISDLKILSEVSGHFSYNVELSGVENMNNYSVDVTVTSASGEVVYYGKGFSNSKTFKNVELWWPRGLGKPNLYNIEVALSVNDIIDGPRRIDVYRDTFGFRSITIENNSSIFINGRKFYCLGFGMHEDFMVCWALILNQPIQIYNKFLWIHGRGFDRAVMIKDLNLLEWMGANCFRTSHYPYSEERIYEADRRGFVVIEELPAVGLIHFTPTLKALHTQMLTELIARDKNHPSVIAWSLSNEAKTNNPEAYGYYKDLVEVAKFFDATRLVTAVYSTEFNRDKTVLFIIIIQISITPIRIQPELMDFICLNRYYGWYHHHGYLNAINESVIIEVLNWRSIFAKPLIFTEYGADSIPGLSELPSIPFSTEYQSQLIKETNSAFDFLRQRTHLAGEMVWNFADFMTQPSLQRVAGNHKGLFTRSREPKPSAFILRDRYTNFVN